MPAVAYVMPCNDSIKKRADRVSSPGYGIEPRAVGVVRDNG